MNPKVFEKIEMPQVKNIIVIASGKGGVGKSTVAANLAVSLTRQGLKTALVDADLYGPSIPMMLGVHNEHPSGEDTMKELLEKENADMSVVDSLIFQGLIKEIKHEGMTYYLRNYHF